MRDFTSHEYCDFLWISDLLSLKKDSSNEFRMKLKRNGKEKCIKITHVTLFGVVVEIKNLGEKGILYSVDDGTGIIVCKHNDQLYNEMFDMVREESGKILNETFANETSNESQFNCTAASEDDTIFNDHSIQLEEGLAIKRNMLKGLHSIWCDVQESFSSMVIHLNIGDTVHIQGKLYTYFNVNQVHINTIRLMDVKEELILNSIKLERGHEQCLSGKPGNEVLATGSNRKSGLMTFDHIHHMEARNVPSLKIVVRERSSDGGRAKRRRSIAPPPPPPQPLHGSMTFDTFVDLNESGAGAASAESPR